MSGVENQLALKEPLGGSEEVVKVGEGAPDDVLKADQEAKTNSAASGDIQAEVFNGTGEKRKRVEDENDAGDTGEKNDEGQNEVTNGDKKSAEVDSKEIDRKKLKVGETTEKSGSSGWFSLSGLWSSSGKKPENEEKTGTLKSASDPDQLGTRILRMELLSGKNSSWSPFSTSSNVRQSTSLEHAGWSIKCSGDADISYQMYDMGNGLIRIRFGGNLNGHVSNKKEESGNFVEFEVKSGELSNQVLVKVPESFEINTLKVIKVEDGIIDVIARETGNGDEDQDKDSDSTEEGDAKNQENLDEDEDEDEDEDLDDSDETEFDDDE